MSEAHRILLADDVCDSVQAKGLPAEKLVKMIWLVPKVLYCLLAARCVRARVWSQSAFVEGLEEGNTYGSFGKLKQLVTLKVCSLIVLKTSYSAAAVHVPPQSVRELNPAMD